MEMTAAKRRWILVSVILASGMGFLDGSIVNVALPVIQTDLDALISDIQWVVNAYALTLAAFLLTFGALGDKFGRRRMFSIGIAVFVLGSAFCAFSTSAAELIAARAFQGLGAALMIPESLAIINATFPNESRGRAIGIWAGFAGAIAAFGPVLGGWIVQTLSWQAIFLINIPIGLLAYILTVVFVPESMNPRSRRIDWRGTVMISLGLFGLSLGIIQGPIWGWESALVVLSLVVGLIFIVLFLIVEARTREPMVPLGLFKTPLVAGANAVTFFLYFALNGIFFFIVLYLQQIEGLTPLQAGMAVLPTIVLITFLSGPAGALSDRIGPRMQMVLGPSVVAAGMVLFAFASDLEAYWVNVFPGLVLIGLGMALVIAPLTKSALSVHEHFSGAASGVNNALSRIGALLAVAVLGAVVVTIFSSSLAAKLDSPALNYSERMEIIGRTAELGGLSVPPGFDDSEREVAVAAVKDSFTLGFRWAAGICAALALLSAGIAAATIKNQGPVQSFATFSCGYFRNRGPKWYL